MLLATQLAAERVRERAADVLGRGGYQRDLPAGEAPFELHLPDLGSLGKLPGVVAWAGLAVLVTLAALWVARRLGGGHADGPVDEAGAAPLSAPEIPTASAEALAGEGRYGEAIHALLLETLQALSRAARLPGSFTSREIVERVPLGPRSREALAGLVSAVEVSWFGGAAPTEEDYRGCLGRFHVFLESYRRAA